MPSDPNDGPIKSQKAPLTAWLMGGMISLAIGLIAFAASDFLYNSRRHDLSAADRKEIREQQEAYRKEIRDQQDSIVASQERIRKQKDSILAAQTLLKKQQDEIAASQERLKEVVADIEKRLGGKIDREPR
jgi:peptidoglycan hydrolase CwlO-like protein